MRVLAASLVCAACGATTSPPLRNVPTSVGCIRARGDTPLVPVRATADAVTVCWYDARPHCFVRSLAENRVAATAAIPRDEHDGNKCGAGRCFEGDATRYVDDVDGRRKLVLYSTGQKFEVRDFDDRLRAKFEYMGSYGRFTDGAILVTFAAAGPMVESDFYALDGTEIGPIGPPNASDRIDHYSATPDPVRLAGGRLAFFSHQQIVIHEATGKFVKSIPIGEPDIPRDKFDMDGNDGMIGLPDGRLAVVWGGVRAGAVTLVDVEAGTSAVLPAMRCPEPPHTDE